MGSKEPPLSHCGAEFPFLCLVVGMGTSSTEQTVLPAASPPAVTQTRSQGNGARWDCDGQSGPQPESTGAASPGVLWTLTLRMGVSDSKGSRL